MSYLFYLFNFVLVAVCYGGIINGEDYLTDVSNDDEVTIKDGDIVENLMTQLILNMERKAANPVDRTIEDKTQPKDLKKNINDVYSLILALNNLIMMHIKSSMNTPKPPHYMPPHYSPGQPQYGRRHRRNAEAGPPQMSYEQWYHTIYMPYMNDYLEEVAQYEAKLAAWNQAQMEASIVTNTFGDVTNSWKNPYYDYSRKAYGNFLHEQVIGNDPKTALSQEYGKWKCELLSTKSTPFPTKIATGQQCWHSTSEKCVKHALDGDCDDGEPIGKLEFCVLRCSTSGCSSDASDVDTTNGCHQQYSCANACRIRHLKVTEPHCREVLCERNKKFYEDNGRDGCKESVKNPLEGADKERGYQFNLCKPCVRDGKLPDGERCSKVPTKEECKLGCDLYDDIFATKYLQF